MSKHKILFDHLYTNANKYNFEYNNYILPVFKDGKSEDRRISEGDLDLINPGINLEPFKNVRIPIKPKICTFEFVTELETEVIKKEISPKKLHGLFENKLEKFRAKGAPKELLIELFISIVKFSKKYKFGCPQTAAMLAIFYNTHLYLTCHLFATPEEVYNFFKEYLYCHSISVPPYKIKVFEQKEANEFMKYFCSVYLRNLPLVRLLMLPNYGLLLHTKNPAAEEEGPAKKGKNKKGTK